MKIVECKNITVKTCCKQKRNHPLLPKHSQLFYFFLICLHFFHLPNVFIQLVKLVGQHIYLQTQYHSQLALIICLTCQLSYISVRSVFYQYQKLINQYDAGSFFQMGREIMLAPCSLYVGVFALFVNYWQRDGI